MNDSRPDALQRLIIARMRELRRSYGDLIGWGGPPRRLVMGSRSSINLSRRHLLALAARRTSALEPTPAPGAQPFLTKPSAAMSGLPVSSQMGSWMPNRSQPLSSYPCPRSLRSSFKPLRP
jgi:hypothetical protein